jgi:hypothetical protein
MNESERQQLRERLIEAQLWNEDDERNPADDAGAGAVLLNSMKKLLAEGVYLSYTVSLNTTPINEVFINHEGRGFQLATDGDLYLTVCKAALALPAFLSEHPECAADIDTKP